MRFALLIALLLSTPATALDAFPSDVERVPCSEQDGGDPYLVLDPELTYFPAVEHIGFSCVHLSATLHGMNEPPLHATEGVSKIRVLWTQSFRHPFVFNAEIHNSTDAAIIWRLGKHVGLSTRFVRGDGRILNDDDLRLLTEAVSTSQVCNSAPAPAGSVRDGDHILIEITDREQYCLYQEDNPPEGPQRQLLELMIRLSGANTDDAIPVMEP